MKRFLSLVLALVMTMSLVTVASAKDFTDADAINYAEAIDVVSAVGIIDGYTDGSFNPQGGLTRGAAAKIICNLILGPTTADDLVADAAPYSDVPTSNVFAGYIAYCQKEGIISGYADGTFKPAASLTGFAFMKMLLGALGYDAKIEGYTGNNWSINVAKQALAIGLNDGLDGTFNGAKALTREEACLYAFNTLKATMVEYDETTNIVIGDIEINTTTTEKEVGNTKTSYWGGLSATPADTTMEFCEKYFEDLTVTTAYDAFGRPANKWELDGDEIGTYGEAYAEKDVSRGYNQISALMTSASYLDYDAAKILSTASLYINGVDQAVYALDGSVTTYGYTAGAATYVPKGAVIETFENNKGEVTAVVVYWYDYAKIDAIETDLTTDAKKQGATAYIDLVDLSGSAIGSYYDNYDNGSQPVLGGYTDKYVEGTVLAICGTAIIDSYIPASYTGVPTAAQAPTYKAGAVSPLYFYEGYITVGGNKYEYAGNVNNVGAVDFESEYTVYVSNEGYAFAVDGATALQVDDLYYLVGLYDGSNKGNTVRYAQVVALADGAEKEIVIEAADALGTDNIAAVTGFSTANAGLYSLSDKTATDCRANDGKWNTTPYVGSTAGGDKYDKTISTLADDVKSDAFKIDMAAGKTYLTDKTVFISIESSSAALATKYAVGSMQMKKDDGAVAPATPVPTSVIVLEEKDSNEAVLVIYVANTLKSVVNVNDIVYLAAAPVNAVSTGYAVDLYFMDGKVAKNVVVDSNLYSIGFYTYAINDDGIYELTGSTEALTVGAGQNIAGDELSGWVMNLDATANYAQKLTGTDGTISFSDVDFSGATVIDTRADEDQELDLVKTDITSAAKLAAALDKVAKTSAKVEADVLVEDGVITFVNVYAVDNQP